MKLENYEYLFEDSDYVYLGHSMGTFTGYEKIFDEGLRTSNENVYSTTDILRFTVPGIKEMFKNWKYKNFGNFIILRLPIKYCGFDDSIRYNAFYNIVDDTSYVESRFVMGYYNSKIDTFIKNPNFRSVLSAEEEKELENRLNAVLYLEVKRQGMTTDVREKTSGQVLDDYENMKRFHDAICVEQAQNNQVKRNQKVLVLLENKITDEITMADGTKMMLRQYLEETFFPKMPNNGKFVLKNGDIISAAEYIEKYIISGEINKYNWNLDELFEATTIPLNDVEEILIGEKGKCVNLKSGGTVLSSYYMNVKIQISNKELENALNGFLVSLAMEDVRFSSRGIIKKTSLVEEFLPIIVKYVEPEDVKNIKNFLECISNLGNIGKIFVDTISPYLLKEKELENKDLEEQLKILLNSIDVVGKKVDKLIVDSYIPDENLEELQLLSVSLQQMLEELNLFKNIMNEEEYLELQEKTKSKIEHINKNLETTDAMKKW